MTEKKGNKGQFAAGHARGGRPKGVPNKATTAIKDMVIEALSAAGGVEYLKKQASKNPGAFMQLVGKVLPLQITGSDGGPVMLGWADEGATFDPSHDA